VAVKKTGRKRLIFGGLHPEVEWHRFSVWAREQDWPAIGA